MNIFSISEKLLETASMNKRTALLLLPLCWALTLSAWGQTIDSSKAGEPTDSLLQAGIKLYLNAHYDDAIRILGTAADDTTPGSVHYYLGASYEALNDFYNADQHYRKALRVDSLNNGYRYRLGKLLQQAGAIKNAQLQFDTIVRMDPQFIPAVYELGVLAYNQRNYEPALRHFMRVVRERPRDFMSFFYIGSCLIGMGKSDSATSALSGCITLNPEYVPAMSTLAAIYYSKGDFNLSLRFYTQAMNRRPENAEYHYKVGLCHTKLDEFTKAVPFLLEACRLDTANDTYYGQLAYAYLMNRQYDSAVIAYRKAIEIDRENSTYYTNLGYTLSKMDSSEAAIAAYESAVRACRPEVIGSIYVRLGTLYFYDKDYQKALTSYRQALRYNPAGKEAQFYVAITSDRLKDQKSAIRHYKKYLDLASGDTSQRDWQKQARERLRVLRK
jgi:tetratricopeptide (TPR) repeat protein